MKIAFLLFFLSVGSVAWGQGRAPTKKPVDDKKKSSCPAKSVKEGANDALNSVDTDIHKTGSAVMNGANKALNAVDQGVHKVIGSDRK